jgi:hypothetical protein
MLIPLGLIGIYHRLLSTALDFAPDTRLGSCGVAMVVVSRNRIIRVVALNAEVACPTIVQLAYKNDV